MHLGLGAASPKNQPVLVPVGSITVARENPQAIDLQLDDFERCKADKLNRIRREIRDFNVESFKSRKERELEREKRQRLEASLQNRRLEEQMEKERMEQRNRRLSIQQSLFGEYRRHMTLKEQQRGQDTSIQLYYEQLELQQNQKQDETRIRELGKIFESEHQLHVPQERIKTEGYESAARKELSRELNSYISSQAKNRRERQRLQTQRSLQEEDAMIRANLLCVQKQEAIDRQRRRKQQDSLKRALQRQITLKNQQGAAFPPIVQYRSHYLTEMAVRYS